MTHPSIVGRTMEVVIADRREFDRLALEMLCEQLSHVIVTASVSNASDAVRASPMEGTPLC